MSGHQTRLAARAYQDMLVRSATVQDAPYTEELPSLHFRGRLLMQLGDFLISVGSRLRAQYEPAPCCHDGYPSVAGSARV
jgi:hypothetical protein